MRDSLKCMFLHIGLRFDRIRAYGETVAKLVRGGIEMVKLEVRANSYYDSVVLMLISKELKKIPGVEEALVGMGTDLNKEISRNIGLHSPKLEEITGNDFFIAVKCEEESAAKAAILKVDEMLNKKKEASSTNYYPPTLNSALKMEPELNMAIISVPGKYAADVARECLNNDIHVMMFSDNVSLEDERDLKELAVSRELLMMGPDCGTAIINNTPLAFANVLRKGNIGVVAASGTGTQEVTCIIDQLGGGLSQVIGTGGRDLKAEIGGKMFSMALQALIDDEDTEVITLISKPPAKEIQTKILEQAANGKKPVVVCFIGGDSEEAERLGLVKAVSLEDAAHKAYALSAGKEVKTFDGFSIPMAELDALVQKERAGYRKTQKFVRGLYTGGTLCDEAMKLMISEFGHIYSNIPLNAADALPDKGCSKEHTFLDFGDDAFTVGRPHPMIDPSLRAERVIREGEDEEVAVILVDCVIGFGSHPDPAADLSEAIMRARMRAQSAGRNLTVVASVCGTENDPQSLQKTKDSLKSAGAIVMPSNAQAARLAMKLVKASE